MYHNILEMIEYQAEARPDKTAFIDPDKSITFKELRDKASVVADALKGSSCISRHVAPVAFYMEKSVDAVLGMFGAVYAGEFYSFVDVRQPLSRAQTVLDRLSPDLLITDKENAEKAAQIFDGKIYMIEELVDGLHNVVNGTGLHLNIVGTDPLYVNFTSGSTGVPKGVTVCHRSVINFIDIFTETFGINEEDIIANQAPFDFDVSVKDVYSGLMTGATVVLIPRDYFTNPTALMDYLCDNNVTLLTWAVSAMCFVSIMNGFGYRVPDKIRRVMFSGEVMPVKHLKVWMENLPDATFVNLYGPTEITCNCTYYEISSYDDIKIGKPFRDSHVFLLDEDDKEIIDHSQKGEICVAGTGVALGYYDDRLRTDENFVQNPLNDKYNDVIYRTGDIGSFDEDGNLIYHSRKDFQVKHMGHRIELGEIESKALELSGVDMACVIFDDVKKRLFLYYEGSADKQDILKYLRDELPPFMIPNKVTGLEKLPVNKNGKIDRNALREMK